MALVSGTPGSRALGAALKQARLDTYSPKTRGSLMDLANKLGVGHSTLSQWENGRRIPQPEDVARLLTTLGISGDRYDTIIAIAKSARDTNWLTSGVTGIGEKLAGIMEFERTCTRLTTWSPWNIPGLLQTGEFAHAIVGSSKDKPPAEVEARVTLRVGRRRTLTRRNAPQMLALIGEPALRQNIGGSEVMKDQLDQLLKFDEELPNVTIKVVPIGNGWHPGLNGGFELYEFAHSESIVFLEHTRASAFVTERPDVDAFKESVVTIRSKAIDKDPESNRDSIAMIAAIRDSL